MCEDKTSLYSEVNHVEVVYEAIGGSGVCSADSGSALRGAADAVWARASRMTCAISSWTDWKAASGKCWRGCDSDCGTDGNLA